MPWARPAPCSFPSVFPEAGSFASPQQPGQAVLFQLLLHDSHAPGPAPRGPPAAAVLGREGVPAAGCKLLLLLFLFPWAVWGWARRGPFPAGQQAGPPWQMLGGSTLPGSAPVTPKATQPPAASIPPKPWGQRASMPPPSWCWWGGWERGGLGMGLLAPLRPVPPTQWGSWLSPPPITLTLAVTTPGSQTAWTRDPPSTLLPWITSPHWASIIWLLTTPG